MPRERQPDASGTVNAVARLHPTLALLQRCLLAILLLVPLVVGPDSFVVPFVVPKAVLLQAVALLMVAGYGIGYATGARARRGTDPVSWAYGAVVLAFVLSTLTGADPVRSVWDSLERMGGLVTVASVAIAYGVTTTTITRQRERQLWLLAATALILPVLVVAVLNIARVDVLGLVAGRRPVSTLGHPAYVGGMGLFAAFGAFTAWTSAPSRRRGMLVAVIALAGFAAVILSESRGAFVALIAGVVAIVSSRAAAAGPGSAPRRAVTWSFSALTFTAAAVVALMKSPWSDRLPLVRRIADLSAVAPGFDIRIRTWRIAASAWSERPLLGWGPGTFQQLFEDRYDPELFRHGPLSAWVDDAHNVVMNALAEQGVVGALAVLALFAAIVVRNWLSYRSGTVSAMSASAVTGFVTAHLVDKLFVFEGITSWLHLCLFAALTAPASATRPAREAVSRWRVGVGSTIAISALALIAIAVLPAGIAAHRARAAVGHLEDGEGSRRIDAAIAAAPYHGTEIANMIGAVAAEGVAARSRRRGDLTADRMGTAAYEPLVRHALGARDTITRARLVVVTPALRADAEIVARTARDLDGLMRRFPRRQQIVIARSELLVADGKRAEALELLSRLRDDDPTMAEPWLQIATIHAQAGKVRSARRTLKRARAAGASFRPDQERRAAAIVR
jgi:O-antigen ligase